jgi:xanthine dehydrogenase molybdopterin-binding subunit B
MDADEVRERNLHTSTSLGRFYGPDITNEPEFVDESGEYTLPKLWARLKASAKWEERKQQVERFNAENIWIKQGLAMVPCIYMVSSRSNVAKVSIYSDGSIVAEVGGNEIGQGLYTKVRQMIAFSLSQLWSQVSSHYHSLLFRVLVASCFV